MWPYNTDAIYMSNATRGFEAEVLMVLDSKSSMRMLASAGEKIDPMRASFICLQNLFWNKIFVRHSMIDEGLGVLFDQVFSFENC